MTRSRQMKLGLFLWSDGHHLAAWRHPSARCGAMNLSHYLDLARAAEAAKFDAIFFADHPAVPNRGNKFHASGHIVHFEPLTLLSAIAAHTKNVGLICTLTTSYWEPYHAARLFASLDHISGGRAAWNVVTSGHGNAAGNFGLDQHFEHDFRYDRAREFVAVVKGLWDSWGEGAFVHDKASGNYLDPAEMFPLNHKGKHFSVAGPLNVDLTPCGRPVIVQAGSSEVGQDLAAETADVIFVVDSNIDQARTFYKQVKARASTYGRQPDDIKVLPGIWPVVGSTEKEAKAKYEELQDLIDPEVGLGILASAFGVKHLSGYPLDEPLPDISVVNPDFNAGKGRLAIVLEHAKKNNLTLRQLYKWYAGSRGQHQVCGTPEQIADVMEQWFVSGACDGFNVMPCLFPDHQTEFVEHVIPLLQRRGLFRREYEGATLRENLGLRPFVGRREHHQRLTSVS